MAQPQTQPLPQSNPTGTMDKIKYRLLPTLVDTNYKADSTSIGESHSLPPGKRGDYETQLEGVPLYSVKGSQVLQYISSPQKEGTVEYLDVRGTDAGELMYMRASRTFPNANHMPLKNSCQNQETILANWATINGRKWSDMLMADYVVIYCTAGQDRSPKAVLAYAAAWSRAPNRNPNQKICLLNRGFQEGFISGAGEEPALHKWTQATRNNYLTAVPANLAVAT